MFEEYHAVINPTVKTRLDAIVDGFDFGLCCVDQKLDGTLLQFGAVNGGCGGGK